MSAGDPQGLNPWVDARGHDPHPVVLPHPRTSAEEDLVRFLGPPVRVRRGPRPAVLLLVLLLTGLVALGGYWWRSTAAAFGPPAGLEEAALPLGAPPLGQATTGAFAFTAMQPDGAGPVAYSPCRPIHYVVRPDGAPDGGAELVRTAVARVSAATGLQFVEDGETQESPSTDRQAYQPDVYGRRWAPVLVAWSTAAESPELSAEVAGIAGSASVTRAGRTVYVSGLRHARQRGHRCAHRRARRPGDRARRGDPRGRPPGRPRPRRRPDAADVPEHQHDPDGIRHR